MILGHAHPAVLKAVRAAMARGTSFGAPTEHETHLAEAIARALPSVEQVRMVSSGTEATMSAIRLARGVTGRDRMLKFDGCYHGHSDGLLVGAGSGVATLGIPGSPGVPKAMTELTVQAPFNDLAGVRQAFERWGRGHRVRDRRAGGGQHGLHSAGGGLSGGAAFGCATSTARCSSSTR